MDPPRKHSIERVRRTQPEEFFAPALGSSAVLYTEITETYQALKIEFIYWSDDGKIKDGSAACGKVEATSDVICGETGRVIGHSANSYLRNINDQEGEELKSKLEESMRAGTRLILVDGPVSACSPEAALNSSILEAASICQKCTIWQSPDSNCSGPKVPGSL